MKANKVIRYLILVLLSLVLIWFTYQGINKVLKEETVLSQLYVDEGASIPSVTICLKWLSSKMPNTKTLYKHPYDLALPMSDDWSFDDYMKETTSARKVIQYAGFRDQPSDKTE